ncbi:MAG TPA: GAF domain-containing sensor histidine kinase [Gemmatimonadaceae bacterium]|nr:GAF domain-containing sensor histidine kinase [Gemmatimonadaceae bacterium]
MDSVAMGEGERQIQREGAHRLGGEASLRALVHALAGAGDLETITRLAADAAVEMTRACGAYVEQVVTADDEVEVVATSGDGVPPLHTRVSYPGSLTEEVIARGEPALLAGRHQLGTRLTPYLVERCRTCSGIAVPLIPEGEVMGALVMLRSDVQGHFDATELDRARTLGDLASIALRRVRIVARAREARDALSKSEREQRILAETGRLLSSALNVQKTLDSLAHLLVERLCDWCAIYLPVPGGARRAVLAGRDPDVERLVASVAGEFLAGASNAIVIQVLRTGESALLADVPEHLLTAAATGSPAYAHVLHTITPQSIVVVPLIARERILGAIGLVSTDPSRRYSDDDLELAQQVADRTALAIDNARLYEEAERRAREEAALRQATQAVSASFTIEEIIHQIARSALVATDATGAFVERVSVDEEELEVVAAAGRHVPAVGVRVAFAGSSAEWVIEHDQAEVIPDLGAVERLRPKALSEACSGCPALVVPLVDAGQAIGALFLLRPPGAEGFRPDESERALTFAKLAALAFRKVDLLHTAQRRHEELEHVMESRARLMRGFGHDVRNPLGAADGFLELLEDGIMGALTEQQRDGVHRARNLIHTALDLISDLLDLARAEAGQIDIHPQPVDVRDSVRELAGLYQAQAEAKRLSLDAHIPDDFPVTQSDASRIRQILGNLISNAVKYTDAGGIRVVLDIRSGDDAPGHGRWITVDVSDTGPGIPREMQSHIFQEFMRLQSNGEGGAGVGLAISQRIAHALGGAITVQSEPGAGSTFTLWIPLTDE